MAHCQPLANPYWDCVSAGRFSKTNEFPLRRAVLSQFTSSADLRGMPLLYTMIHSTPITNANKNNPNPCKKSGQSRSCFLIIFLIIYIVYQIIVPIVNPSETLAVSTFQHAIYKDRPYILRGKLKALRGADKCAKKTNIGAEKC
jgi:hypothetical protein